MTLHFSFLCDEFVMHVGDRLLSIGDPGSAAPWDERANKTVVVLGTNAAFIASYTGLAHIGGKDTDQWIAEKLTGRQFRPGVRGGLAISFIGTAPLTVVLNESLTTLRGALEAELPASQSAGPSRTQAIEILVSGRVWRPSDTEGREPALSSFAVKIRHSGKPHAVSKVEWLLPITPAPMPPRLDYVGVDIGSHADDVCARLRELTATDTTSTEIEAVLVGAIREFATQPTGDVVGQDCMAIALGNSEGRVKFHSVDTPTVLYTPFIVGTGALIPATETGPGTSLPFGDYVIRVESVPTVAPGGNTSTRGQPRPRL